VRGLEINSKGNPSSSGGLRRDAARKQNDKAKGKIPDSLPNNILYNHDV
jgi:hypothetical protein